MTPTSSVAIDYDAVLRSLNLNPSDPKTQALMLVCERYGLDPVLKHIVLISGNAYVTRDGYLAVAHRSGQFDGMEVIDQGETKDHYTAKVAVYRKDMRHPFTFVGRFPKSKSMAKDYGPEMAVKVAEVQGLRRAFNVTGVGASDERWDDAAIEVDVLPAEPELLQERISANEAAEITDVLNLIEDEHKRAAAKQDFVAVFGKPTEVVTGMADRARDYAQGKLEESMR